MGVTVKAGDDGRWGLQPRQGVRVGGGYKPRQGVRGRWGLQSRQG